MQLIGRLQTRLKEREEIIKQLMVRLLATRRPLRGCLEVPGEHVYEVGAGSGIHLHLAFHWAPQVLMLTTIKQPYKRALLVFLLYKRILTH